MKYEFQGKKLTLRRMLPSIARTFDRLGFLAPFVITMKIMLQVNWRSGTSCVEQVPHEHMSTVEKWLLQCQQGLTVKLPRHVGIYSHNTNV